jgi:quinoprotein glucose dehydrogenase
MQRPIQDFPPLKEQRMKLRASLFALLTTTLLGHTILPVPARADDEIKDTPIAVEVVRAFPELRIRRPTVLTNAGDGSNRVFVVTQQGVIQSVANDQSVKDVNVFLDIESKVVYKDQENEEGLLGLAFHPKYKENGQFFLYYTTKDAPHTSVVVRQRVSPDDPDKADPDYEEELLRIPQPYWNHNGGNLAFGADGFLYIGLGDGGLANDPHGNGQNLGTWLGSILRIDVDRKQRGKNYAVPRDNPFVRRRGAQPEIWAYGLRNVWGMSFDPETGTLWAGDVGQDIWEEIDLIVRGGNYGWNLREGKHPFGPSGSGPRDDLIEPIWEYHHETAGKSITGGHVYRGKRVPELVGCYLYADYVSGKVWALKYDEKERRVLANYTITTSESLPVIAFGTDEEGESYLTDSFGMIYTLQPKKN